MAYQAEKKEAYKLYKEGYSIADIARELKINVNTLRSWKHRENWKPSASKKTLQKKEERIAVTNELKNILAEEADKIIKNKFLTSKQKLFCAYYVNCFNATEAYQKAYGSSRKTAGASGYNLLKKIEIQKVIEEIQQSKMATALAKESHINLAEQQVRQEIEPKVPVKTSPGTYGVDIIKNTPRPDKTGAHRVMFEKNKKRICATQSVCAICGQPVDFNLKYPHPLSACIDHIIPVAKGGHPSDIDNLQLAHLTCNRQKSDKLSRQSKGTTIEEVKIGNRVLPQSVDWRSF